MNTRVIPSPIGALRIRDGQNPKVRVFDKNAPSQRPVVTPQQDQQRGRERAAPAR